MILKQLSSTVQSNRASQGTRLLNYLIDFTVFYIFIFFLGIFLGILAVIGIEAPLQWLLYLDGNRALDYLVTSILYFIYIFSFEYFTKGRSIGKYITKTKVVSVDGTAPTQKDFFIRNISRLVPFDGLSFLKQDGGWHDLWSDTRVVNWEKYKSDYEMQQELNELGKNPN